MDYATDLESMRHEQERKLEEAWRAFVEQFPTEFECVEFLCSFVSASNSMCSNCGSDELERKFGEREGRCKKCRRTNHPTAQTFFHRVRKIRPWLARIFFFEHGVCVSSSKFAKMLEIASSTAQIIFKKLTSVLLRHLIESGINVLSKALLKIVARRSLKTPADEHPIEEESVLAEQVQRNEETRQAHASTEKSNALNETTKKDARDNGLEATEVQVYELISDEAITLDELCALAKIPGWTVSSTLTILELKGLISSLPGERYVKVKKGKLSVLAPYKPDTSEIENTPRECDSLSISDVLVFVRLFFRRISRKYLQHYLGAHWGFADRNRWTEHALLGACLQVAPVSYAEVMSYVSPLKMVMSEELSELTATSRS